jgi:VWFA-related protein
MQRLLFYFLLLLALSIPVFSQEYRITKSLPPGGTIDILNLSGRVSVIVAPTPEKKDDTQPVETAGTGNVSVVATSDKGVSESEVKLSTGVKTIVEVAPARSGKQINLTVTVPARSRIRIETRAGAVDVSGNLEAIDVTTDTGTVSTDLPDDAVTYDLVWTAARPRFLADFELDKVKEGAAGKFSIRGKHTKTSEDKPEAKKVVTPTPSPTARRPEENALVDAVDPVETGKIKKKKVKDQELSGRTDVDLRVTTQRGIVLVNVDETEVGSDLRERPLTVAAKAIVRSGDSFLMDAIRRASPKYFGEYARTLPPAIREPYLTEKTSITGGGSAGESRTMLVNVTDTYNRSIGDLQAKDFEVIENGEARDVVSVRPVTAPFNLVLLLDVSGSVDNYVNFIRKAARSFVDTMGSQDRIAIVTFNDDVHVLSTFTTDKASLSTSLDSFDAGGGTAYYDALAYTLADTLRPLRGDRTAIVVLTDGDDNRSFLPFDSLKGTIQESGALIYPLYVPSSLIAASATTEGQANSVDWLRRKYMGLTTKAEGEGPKLAKASGGVYYPITQLSQIQTAYDDIAKQLRTAYSVTFKTDASDAGKNTRYRIKVKRENAFVKFANQ